MPNFTGQLNPNEIFAPLYNMIISQQVFANNLESKKNSLVEMGRVDGSMYGDTKLYYATDALKSAKWGNDAEAQNLLKLHRPKAPDVQAIKIDTFRYIPLTIDNYLTKRAWMEEGAFSSFNSVMLGWMRETKEVYDITTYNAFIGTAKSDKATENITIDLTTPTKGLTGDEKARTEAQVIGEQVSNMLVNLEDISRDYNDYGNLRSYSRDKVIFVWNSKVIAGIQKRDLPTIYHKDGIIDKFGEYVLPDRFFGTVNTDAKVGDGTTIRSLIEQDVTKSGATNEHVFAGDLIPNGYNALAGTTYTVDSNVLFKVYHIGPNSVPYMSGFEAETSFFNPLSLTENHYLIWGHNTLEYLKNYPFITVKKA